MTYTIREEQVRIPSSTPGIELSGVLITPQSSETDRWPAVLFVHGTPENLESKPLKSILPRARILAENGFITLLYVCRGVDGSDGNYGDLSDAIAVRDLGAAYRWLRRQENVQDNRIGVWGSSWGGYQACMSLTDIDPASLFLNVPALYEESRYEQTFSSADLEERQRFRPSFQGWNHEAFRRLASYTHPTHIVMAEEDEMVPINCQVGYLLSAGSNAASEAYILKDCGHSIRKLPQAEEILRSLIVDWFIKTLSS